MEGEVGEGGAEAKPKRASRSRKAKAAEGGEGEEGAAAKPKRRTRAKKAQEARAGEEGGEAEGVEVKPKRRTRARKAAAEAEAEAAGAAEVPVLGSVAEEVATPLGAASEAVDRAADEAVEELTVAEQPATVAEQPAVVEEPVVAEEPATVEAAPAPVSAPAEPLADVTVSVQPDADAAATEAPLPDLVAPEPSPVDAVVDVAAEVTVDTTAEATGDAGRHTAPAPTTAEDLTPPATPESSPADPFAFEADADEVLFTSEQLASVAWDDLPGPPIDRAQDEAAPVAAAPAERRGPPADFRPSFPHALPLTALWLPAREAVAPWAVARMAVTSIDEGSEGGEGGAQAERRVDDARAEEGEDEGRDDDQGGSGGKLQHPSDTTPASHPIALDTDDEADDVELAEAETEVEVPATASAAIVVDQVASMGLAGSFLQSQPGDAPAPATPQRSLPVGAVLSAVASVLPSDDQVIGFLNSLPPVKAVAGRLVVEGAENEAEERALKNLVREVGPGRVLLLRASRALAGLMRTARVVVGAAVKVANPTGRRWELACGVADCVQAWREESVLAAARMEAFGRVEGSLP